jgi:hypothetical protein
MFSLTLLLGALSTRCVAGTGAGQLEITEVTAFKDGHALVVRAGPVALNADGDAVLRDLPRPILGTFWADEDEAEATLASVVSERVEEVESLPAASLAALLEANIGSRVAYLDVRNEVREGILREIIRGDDPMGLVMHQSAGWVDHRWMAYPQPVQPPTAPKRIALVETASGVASIPVEQLRDLRFLDGAPRTSVEVARERERMTLDLEWEHGAPGQGNVRLMYVQKGVRWIPSYRVTLLDDERVQLELQATIVNELADLRDVTMNFAVGVPSFAFAESPDPMGLQDVLASLGPYFGAPSGTGAMLSNAIMSQSAMMRYDGSASPEPAPASAELTGSERSEDLFVYTVEHVTLRRGARMVVPLVSYDVCYESLYRLEIPARPSFDMARSIPADRMVALERALTTPIPRHVLRILNENDERYPITTAPALVIRDGYALAQGMLSFTAPGGVCDLEVGRGVEIGVEAVETEGERELKAVHWNGSDYARARHEFSVAITNRKDAPVRMEVVKAAFGERPEVGQDGEVEMLGLYDPVLSGNREWAWWRGQSWPWWWSRFNSTARVSWAFTLDAGERVELDASWWYYWR